MDARMGSARKEWDAKMCWYFTGPDPPWIVGVLQHNHEDAQATKEEALVGSKE